MNGGVVLTGCQNLDAWDAGYAARPRDLETRLLEVETLHRAQVIVAAARDLSTAGQRDRAKRLSRTLPGPSLMDVHGAPIRSGHSE